MLRRGPGGAAMQRQVSCPNCRSPLRITEESEEQFNCPYCRVTFFRDDLPSEPAPTSITTIPNCETRISAIPHVPQDTQRGVTSLLAPRQRQPARWNVVSTFMPFFGFLCALLSAGALADMLGVSHPAAVLGAALSFWFGFGFLGLFAAVISIVRAERLWGFTIVGFLLNCPLALGFLLCNGWGEPRDHLMGYVCVACLALLVVGCYWPRRSSSN